MEFAIAAAASILIDALLTKNNVVKHADRFAKIYVKVERVAESNATLAAAIQRQREK